MRDLNPRGFVAIAADQIDASGKQWIEVMPTADKARNGRWYFTITAADLAAYADFIRANPDRIPVDYDHEGADGGSTVAAGWFTGLAELRGPDDDPRLWAQVEWTSQGQEAIRDKRFRFISPEWSMQNKDAKTGLMTKAKGIIAATLTNRPFFKELAPVASVVWTATEGLESLRQRVAQALNPGALDQSRYWVMDVAAGSALIQEYAAQKTWVAAFSTNDDGSVAIVPASEWVEAQQEWVAAAAEAMQSNLSRKPFKERNEPMPENLTALAKSLGLPEDADETKIAQAIKARDDENAQLKAQVDDLTKKVLPEDEVKNLVAQAAQGAEALKQLDELKVDNLLASAVRDGKIVPAQKDAYAAMARVDFDGVKALIDSTPEKALAHLVESGSGGDGDDDSPKADDATRAAFTQDKTGKKPVLPDDESLDLHMRAEKILADAGKASGYSADDYAQAIDQASRQTA